ncbi:MAG: SUMF1/EgtB/PvdO family nonheme iron enzyme [Deltaproteobacteria bacterium]|nr:SUMF1/EgtB/PvdO family nonheme iron enzyme [Deltaproteobacteria bacterium]
MAIDAAPTDGEVSDARSSDAVAVSRCPSEMILVTGKYCPDVRHTCTQWMDPPGTYEHFRCARYGIPVCASPEKIALSFCIDRDEYTAPGDTLPLAHQSWSSARTRCESLGKRLCMESEWHFACEGEEMRPYPYGFERDATACNIDRTNLGKPNSGLRDLREPAGSHPRCVSPFGVRDMSGNVEEWATLDKPPPSDGGPIDRSTMKGAWWLPGRNHCRAATTGHGETYEGGQVGVRCCKDPG